jgi:hypothetical protein
VVENITKYPLDIILVSVVFTQASKKNIKNTVQEIEEYKERIRSLEVEVTFYKGDRTNIQEFRVSVEEVKK